MVGAIKKWLGISKLERENLSLVKAALDHEDRVKSLETRLDVLTNTVNGAHAANMDDCEARIAFLEKSLTSKPSTAKIVPKAHKTNWKQFRSAAERASEPEQETA